MEYTVQKLAKLAGVSPRTVRYYDTIGLLRPTRITSGGYRIYGRCEVDALQQILLYREMGLDLSAIAKVLSGSGYDRLSALKNHLAALRQEQVRLQTLIGTVECTIVMEEGGETMEDKAKFEGFKREMVEENERKYGKEIREKYGEDTVRESNARMLKMTKAQMDEMQALAEEILARIEAAVTAGESPEGGAGREVAMMHRKWLGFTWPQYSVEAHKGVTQMYVDDERFTAYYDRKMPGCALFIRDAVHRWADELNT